MTRVEPAKVLLKYGELAAQHFLRKEKRMERPRQVTLTMCAYVIAHRELATLYRVAERIILSN